VAALVSLKRSYSAPILENLGLCVGNCEARADCQSGKLVECVAAGLPICQLVLIETFRHARMPFAGYRSNYRARVELTAIDAHRAAACK
jgi:hypothetical protein